MRQPTFIERFSVIGSNDRFYNQPQLHHNPNPRYLIKKRSCSLSDICCHAKYGIDKNCWNVAIAKFSLIFSF